MQYVQANVDYSNYEQGSLSTESGTYQNLMNNIYTNPVGQGVIAEYDKDPSCHSGLPCTQSSYRKMAAGYKNATDKDFPKEGSAFFQIWSNWADANNVIQNTKLGASPELANYGSVAAIDWAKMGQVFNKDQIWSGILQPGDAITYQGIPSHSAIFLGYTYNDDGSISGLNIWNQYSDSSGDYFSNISKGDNKDLKAARITVGEENK